MAFKIKHISTRFFLQSIFTILIIATLIFIMFYSGFRKKDTLVAQELISEIDADLIVASLTLGTAIDQQKGNADFVETGADNLIALQEEILNKAIENLSQLEELKFLRSYFQDELLPDTLQAAIKEYSLLFSKTVYSLKEKGNVHSGLVAESISEINAVSEALWMAPDEGTQAEIFDRYASAYTSSISERDLNNLISFCDEVVSPLYFYDDFDVYALEEQVASLKTKLSGVQNIDLRLNGSSESAGQYSDLEASYSTLLEVYERFEADIKSQTNKYNSWWIWVFAIVAVLFTVAYIIVMGHFSRIVRTSVRDLHETTIALANGNITDNLEEGGRYEFEEYNKDLKALLELLNKRKEFIDELLADNFDANLEIKSDNDDIGNALINLKAKMYETQQEQQRYNQENSDRRYINEGLAKFGDIMRVHTNDTSKLSDKFIAELVKYMNALQGVLFLSQEGSEDKLDLMAAFAFDRKRFLQKTLKKGEGLIGTCAIEQKTIVLDDVPEEYVAIRSGLGDTPPSNVLLLPVMNEDVLVGVVELASLNSFTKIQVELAENIASNLASTIIGSRINAKTSDLLKKSQEQAAEMAEQEEEMRQNMEELKATQEESARREEEMQGLLDAIGKSFFVLEYDVSGKIIHVNDRLLEFIEQPIDQVLRRSHQEVLSSDSSISIEMIKEIVVSNTSKTVVESLNWGSKQYRYTCSLSPVLNNLAQVNKVLNLFSIEEIVADS